MNTDIRVLLSFRGSRKRRKLSKRLGPGATDYLLDLWIGTATSRPDGVLTGWDEEDIALEANYPGEPGELVSALLDVGWLDIGEDGVYSVHDWVEHNPYASGADDRSDASGKGAVYRWVRSKLYGDEYKAFAAWFKGQEYKKGTGYKKVIEQYRAHEDNTSGSNADHMRNDAKRNAPLPLPSPLPSPSPLPVPTPTVKKEKDIVLPVPGEDAEQDEPVRVKVEAIPYKAIVDELNRVCGANYQPTNKKTKGLIKARWGEGFRLADFKAVVACKHAEWSTDDKAINWLRPQTLFSGNFEAYLQEARRGSGGAVVSEAEEAMAAIRREQEAA